MNVTLCEYWRYRLRRYAFEYKEKFRGMFVSWLLRKTEHWCDLFALH
jgi:hypothetical protein